MNSGENKIVCGVRKSDLGEAFRWLFGAEARKRWFTVIKQDCHIKVSLYFPRVSDPYLQGFLCNSLRLHHANQRLSTKCDSF